MIDILYEGPAGQVRRVRETVAERSEQAALRRHAEILEELKAGTYSKNKEVQKQRKNEEKPDPTLAEFAQEFLDRYAAVNNRPATVEMKRRVLERDILPHLGTRRLSTISRRDIDNVQAKLFTGPRGTRKKKTVRNNLAVLSKLMHYAEEVEVIRATPRFRLPRPEKAKFDFLDFEEADRLIGAAGFNPEWKAMVVFALRTGLRYGELCELRWEDVDLVKGQVVVSRSFHRGNVGEPKSGKDRVLPLSEETVKLLKEQRRRQNRQGQVVDLSTKELTQAEERELLKNTLVFSKPDGGRHIHRRADVALKRICKKAGLRRIGWHALRHTFASHLVMRNVPLKSVQELMGHATIEMTMRYAHLAPHVNRSAVEVLDAPHRVLWHMHGTSGEKQGSEGMESASTGP